MRNWVFFCHRCGLLGHTDKVCPELFELEADDNVRNWGADLKPVTNRIGTGATNRQLQDPIPATVPRQTNAAGGTAADRNTSNGDNVIVPSFNDCMLAMQSQITAIKHDVLAAQIAAKEKHGAGVNSPCQVHLLSSSSTGNSTSNLLPSRPLVLGLPAAPFRHDNIADSQEQIGSELEKKERVLPLQNCVTTPLAADGGEGNVVI